MGSLSHITLSNSIQYNSGKTGEQERNTEGDYEPVIAGSRNREQSIPTTFTNPSNHQHPTIRINQRGTGGTTMKNTVKITYVCLCTTMILALQIWNVIMMKYVESKISRAAVKNDNLPVQRPCFPPGLISMIAKKLDLIMKDTNYNLPYMIMNHKSPKDFEIYRPKGLFIPYGTSAELSSFPVKSQSRKNKINKRDNEGYTKKWRIKFKYSKQSVCNYNYTHIES